MKKAIVLSLAFLAPSILLSEGVEYKPSSFSNPVSSIAISGSASGVSFQVSPSSFNITSDGLLTFGATPYAEGNFVTFSTDCDKIPAVFSIKNIGSGNSANTILSVGVYGDGDPALKLGIAGSTTWYVGVDNSNSDSFSITGAGNDDSPHGSDLVLKRLTASNETLIGDGTTAPIARLHVDGTGVNRGMLLLVSTNVQTGVKTNSTDTWRFWVSQDSTNVQGRLNVMDHGVHPPGTSTGTIFAVSTGTFGNMQESQMPFRVDHTSITATVPVNMLAPFVPAKMTAIEIRALLPATTGEFVFNTTDWQLYQSTNCCHVNFVGAYGKVKDGTAP